MLLQYPLSSLANVFPSNPASKIIICARMSPMDAAVIKPPSPAALRVMGETLLAPEREIQEAWQESKGNEDCQSKTNQVTQLVAISRHPCSLLIHFCELLGKKITFCMG